jgi:hypothetical protein
MNDSIKYYNLKIKKYILFILFSIHMRNTNTNINFYNYSLYSLIDYE